MSYLALARKWRPRTFSQLVGQDHINNALINSLTQQRLHHAYLFTGTRGVGKTSVARLLAKSMNCETGITAEPCLLCDSCLAIEQGRCIDLIEIDGASKTRVEDTREVLENVQYRPTNSRFKIYLIDEVHMLSQHSFNALLKTLEEPPSHVKFLLATTDPQKLPITVLSRCLQFNLKHLPAEIITPHLGQILNKESIPFESEAVELLAKAAKGSMRDALSLLDQAIVSADSTLKACDVKQILGYSQQDYALQLLQALAKLDAQDLISISRQIASEGGHFRYVLDGLLDYFHQITLKQCLPKENPLIHFTPELHALALQFSPEDVQLCYQIGIKGLEEIYLAPTLAIGFEMTLLRMLTFRPAARVDTPKLAHELDGCSEELTKASEPKSGGNSSKEPFHPEQSEGTLGAQEISHCVRDDEVLYEQSERAPQGLEISHCVRDGVVLSEQNEGSPEGLEISHGIRDDGVLCEQNEGSPEGLEISHGIRDDGVLCEQKEGSPEGFLEILNSARSDEVVEEDWQQILSHLKLSGIAQTAVDNSEWIGKSGFEITLRVAKGHQSLFTPTVTARIVNALKDYYKEPIKIALCSDEPVQSSPAKQKKKTQDLRQQKAESTLQQDPFFQQIKEEFSAELVKNSIVSMEDDL